MIKVLSIREVKNSRARANSHEMVYFVQTSWFGIFRSYQELQRLEWNLGPFWKSINGMPVEDSDMIENLNNAYNKFKETTNKKEK